MRTITIRRVRIKWELYIVSELYQAGTTIDGMPYEAEVYVIHASRDDGKRLVYNGFYGLGCEISRNSEGVCFRDVRVMARAQAEKKLAEVKKNFNPKDDDWVEIEPSYGSPYYCKVYGF